MLLLTINNLLMIPGVRLDLRNICNRLYTDKHTHTDLVKHVNMKRPEKTGLGHRRWMSDPPLDGSDNICQYRLFYRNVSGPGNRWGPVWIPSTFGP